MEPCTSATKAFYDEVKYYDYNNPGFSQKTGHFTQIVWKNTKQIGAAYATRRDGRFVLVIRYSPPGNYRYQFRQNVLPIKEETKTTVLTPTETTVTSTAPAPPHGGVSGQMCCSFTSKVLLIIFAILVVKIGFWYRSRVRELSHLPCLLNLMRFKTIPHNSTQVESWFRRDISFRREKLKGAR